MRPHSVSSVSSVFVSRVLSTLRLAGVLTVATVVTVAAVATVAAGCGNADPSQPPAPDALVSADGATSGTPGDDSGTTGPGPGPGPGSDAGATPSDDAFLPDPEPEDDAGPGGNPDPTGDDGGTGPSDDATPTSDGTVDPEDDLGPPGTVTPDEDGGTEPDPTDPPPTTTPPANCPTFRLRHLQSSQQRTDSVAQRNASIAAAFDAGAHTISWTEIENLSDARTINARAGWDTFWPSGQVEAVARNAIPISWRTDTFELMKGRTWLASEGRAMVSPSRWVTRVWLRHKASGAISSRVAHHSVSGVDGAGEAPVAWRREMHAKDIAKFKEVMLLENIPVVGSGDFNTTRLRNLLGTGFKYDVPGSGGSHGSRLIDWVVRRNHAELRFVSTAFVTVGNSDHKGVRAVYDYQPSCQ